MVFDPKMQSDFAFNRPVETPNFMGVVANLFDFGASSIMKAREGGQRQLTADERFAVDWQNFLNSKPAATQVDRKLAVEFLTKHPQHGKKPLEHIQNMGVPVVEDPMVQAVQGGLNKYSSDPRFIAAAGAASTLPEPQREAHMLKMMQKLAEEDAEIARINQEATKLSAEGSLTKVQWEAIAGNQKDFADNIVSSTLGPIILSIKNGQPFALSPEQQAQLGVRYNSIDLKNFPMVLQDTRNFLAKSFRDQYLKQFGKDGGLPPKELEDRVLASVDALIKASQEFDSPQEVASALEAMTDARMWENASKQGLDGMLWGLKNLPPEFTINLRTNAEFSEKIGKFLLDTNGNPKPPEEIAKGLDAASVAEAEDMAKRIATFGPVNRELFEAQKASLARSGKDLVDWATFNKILAVGSGWMTTEANNDPQFRQDTQDWFMADIQKHAELIRRNLYPGTELSFQNGRYVLIQTTSAPLAPSSMRGLPAFDEPRVGGGSASARTPIQITQDRLPKGVTVDDLNRKLSGLRTVKGFGQEVVDAVIEMELGAAPPGRVLGGEGDDKVKGSAGSDTFQLKIPKNSKADYITNGLIRRGMPQHIAEGFLVNFHDESSLNPSAVGDNGAAFGLAQWNGPRKRALEAYAASVGKPASDIDTQLDFLMIELGSNESNAWSKIQQAGNASEAAIAILNHFERPAEVNRAKREARYGGGVSLAFDKEEYAPQTINVAALTSAGTVGEAIPSGAPQEPRTAAVERMATPDVERVARGLPEASPEARERALEILKTKPMDPEVKALIEALIGVQNA